MLILLATSSLLHPTTVCRGVKLPRPHRRSLASMRDDTEHVNSLCGCADALLEAADAIVAAAAVLGENQRQEEEPGRWSAAGCALANAARDLKTTGGMVGEGDWACATEPLAAAAVSFSTASAWMPLAEDDIATVAAECEDAAAVSGCISLAAAAGPNLIDAGEALLSAGGAILSHGEAMEESAATSAHTEAGCKLREAGHGVQAAALRLQAAGAQLEMGQWQLAGR